MRNFLNEWDFVKQYYDFLRLWCECEREKLKRKCYTSAYFLFDNEMKCKTMFHLNFYWFCYNYLKNFFLWYSSFKSLAFVMKVVIFRYWKGKVKTFFVLFVFTTFDFLFVEFTQFKNCIKRKDINCFCACDKSIISGLRNKKK